MNTNFHCFLFFFLLFDPLDSHLNKDITKKKINIEAQTAYALMLCFERTANASKVKHTEKKNTKRVYNVHG